MGLGPVSAIEALAARTGHEPAEADRVEINEAFAAQVLAVLRLLREHGYELPRDRLNVNGGAIALGHPVGATGARLVLTQLEGTAAPPRRAPGARLALRRRRPGRRPLAGGPRS